MADVLWSLDRAMSAAHLLDVIVVGVLADLQQLVVVHALGLLQQQLGVAQELLDAGGLRLHFLHLQVNAGSTSGSYAQLSRISSMPSHQSRVGSLMHCPDAVLCGSGHHVELYREN